MRRTDRYAGIARWYDPATAALLRDARQRLVRLCVARGFRRALDVGCGTGVVAVALHEAGLAVTCTDTSPAMLAVAARRTPPDIPCLVAGLPLPFADDSFDIAVLALVLHESESEPEDVLAEALRVAPAAVVLELRMPERNLDLVAQPLVHAVERLAGKAHYRRFRDFTRKGCLHGVAARARARVVRETSLLAGTLVLAEIARQPDSAAQSRADGKEHL